MWTTTLYTRKTHTQTRDIVPSKKKIVPSKKKIRRGAYLRCKVQEFPPTKSTAQSNCNLVRKIVFHFNKSPRVYFSMEIHISQFDIRFIYNKTFTQKTHPRALKQNGQYISTNWTPISLSPPFRFIHSNNTLNKIICYTQRLQFNPPISLKLQKKYNS